MPQTLGVIPAVPGFDNTYVRDLPSAGVAWEPARWPQVREVWFNGALAADLGLPWAEESPARRALWCAGQERLPGSEPFAQAYAGHQFGGFSPQLGDGRALLLGEWVDARGRRRDLALKGSGRTPFSRGGDGKAALGPMLREVIISEAMHALGVPTTRALAVVATGEPVIREEVLPGAVLMRVAASHLRVGTFEFFAARGDHDTLARLTDYAIARHDPALAEHPDRVLAFLQAVVRRQAQLVAQWMSLGFIHGVMNTDNMTISGETIDYGPCAFMEAFNPDAVFSSIDRQGRYAWGRQPAIAQWNLARLAEALLPLIDEDQERAVGRATEVINTFGAEYSEALLNLHQRKLGLCAADQVDRQLAEDWLALLQACDADHTRAWRSLVYALEGDERPVRAEVREHVQLQSWLERWRERGAQTGLPVTQRTALMRASSPVVIPRNHLVEQALEAATEHQDLRPLEDLLAALARAGDDLLWDSDHAQPAPAEVTARYRTYCGT